MSDARIQELIRELRERYGIEGWRVLGDELLADLGMLLDVFDAMQLVNERALANACRETPYTSGDLHIAVWRLKRSLQRPR